MSPALRVALSIAVICAAVEAGGILQQRAVDLDGDVARQQRGEDLFLVRLIFDRGRGGRPCRPRRPRPATTGMICSTVGSCTSADLKRL